MSLDGITLAAIKNEFIDKLIGGRIDKIYQPKNELITIKIRQPGQNIKLLISADPQNPRIHISEENFDNPLRPPAFCMLLRKHIESGRIKSVTQPNFERILEITVQHKNNQGELEDKTLVVELMGRHSNIILLNEDKHILDSIKRITSQKSRYREILPGKKYVSPPEQGKHNPLTTNEDEFSKLLRNDFGEPIYRVIMNNYRGIGPLLATEIAYRANLNPQDNLSNFEEINKLKLEFFSLFEQIKNSQFEPTLILKDNNTFKNYSAVDLKQFNLCKKKYESISELMNFYFVESITRKKINKLTEKMTKVISDNKEKAHKKYRKVKGQLKGALNADKYQLKGELITANIYQLKKGDKKVKLNNYYDNNKEITISLDPQLSPAENAQKYFKKYEKSKKSVKYLKNESRKAKNEINYLKQLEVNIEQSTTLDELEEIYEELIQEAYIKKQRHNKNKKDNKLPPLKFKSSDGYDILVGRNNRQNDKLTKKIANNQDTWLHVKDIPGSHTIIRNHTGDKIPENTILEASQIAAFYSKGRNSSNVPVDYTSIKDVKKPKGAKPGMVYYENQTTLYVDPDEQIVNGLKIQD
ncbi:Rqc2 family fibronectin-binding protein [Orenia marismortui]|uniref:Rqc2 homolog RqcH n=1 Tax=Orenia marismortui TaxID=46469 RepID=A0A4R8H0P1_9FIRM|nr:NFACT RNA binding domain-containing protein [Orenia marismortui]TDX52778.1 putative ribosome quality control (RQC) complex YloA/Tae2 family protein [Orenia marismortui]